MQTSSFKRAASSAALYVFVLVCCALPAAVLPAVVPWAPSYVLPAGAKMKVERLTISKASGGEPLPFEIELAASDQEKSVGLMFRTTLADTAGMLFPYGSEQTVTMWMRNTYIPLDMLFIRADGVIHRIEVMAEPLSERVISSGAPVFAVLELAGGATGRLGIKAGDRVQHPIFGAVRPPK